MTRKKVAKKRKRYVQGLYAHQMESPYATNEDESLNPSNPHWKT